MARLVEAQYKYHDDPQVYSGIIGVGIPEDLHDQPEFDDKVFYYVDTEEELEALYDTTEEDFVLVRKEQVMPSECQCVDCDAIDIYKDGLCEPCYEEGCDN